jgi:Dynamin family
LICPSSSGVVKDDNKNFLEMARSYLGMPRTVILTIVHARSDIDNQQILPIIEEKDPKGDRTIGVITKLDQIDNDDRAQFSLLARNEKDRLKRGRHVVRNRGSGEERSFDQAKTEAEVFQDEPWKGLLPSQLGIENLRTRLSKVFLSKKPATVWCQ